MFLYIITFLILLLGVLCGLIVGLLMFKPKNTEPVFVKCEYRKNIDKNDGDTAPENTDATGNVPDTNGNDTNTDNGDVIWNVSDEEAITVTETGDSSVLKHKLGSRKKSAQSTMVEFNCAADGIDTKEYVKKRQNGEDSSYSILKDKLKEKKNPAISETAAPIKTADEDPIPVPQRVTVVDINDIEMK